MNDEVQLDERVQMICTFGSGVNPCRPVRFRRPGGQEVTVTEIGLGYPTLAGRRMVHVFDVTDGASDYRLEFDSERLTWRLTRQADRYE